MIIKYVESKPGFWIFLKDKIVVATDDGEGSVDGRLEEPVVAELNSKLKDYNVFSSEDFINLKKLCNENYGIIEKCLINASKRFWAVLSEDASVIPRPMSMVLKKSSGIREFYVISLDCMDFSHGVYVNDRIIDYVKSKLYNMDIKADEKGSYHNLEDSKVFAVLQEAIKEIAKGITFNVRVAVNFKGDYSGRTLEEHFKYLVGLVFGENILFAINPLNIKEPNHYRRLKEKVMGDCYLAVTSLNGFEKEDCDFLAVKGADLAELSKSLRMAKEKGLNIIFDGNADVCVGFGFPILRLGLMGERETEQRISRVERIFEEIKERRAELKAEKENKLSS